MACLKILRLSVLKTDDNGRHIREGLASEQESRALQDKSRHPSNIELVSSSDEQRNVINGLGSFEFGI